MLELDFLKNANANHFFISHKLRYSIEAEASYTFCRALGPHHSHHQVVIITSHVTHVMTLTNQHFCRRVTLATTQYFLAIGSHNTTDDTSPLQLSLG